MFQLLTPSQPKNDIVQGEEPPDTGGGPGFSLDASCGLLATVSASALALFFGSALSSCGVSCGM